MRNNNLAPRNRMNTDPENDLEDAVEAPDDNEPGNPRSQKVFAPPRKVFAGNKVRSANTSGALTGSGPTVPGMHRQLRPRGKLVKSKSKNRTGKKYRGGGPGKHPPTVAQKMASFGGM